MPASEPPFMTLDQAEEILAAHEAGVFKGRASEVAHAWLMFDRAYDESPAVPMSREEIDRMVKEVTEKARPA